MEVAQEAFMENLSYLLSVRKPLEKRQDDQSRPQHPTTASHRSLPVSLAQQPKCSAALKLAQKPVCTLSCQTLS